MKTPILFTTILLFTSIFTEAQNPCLPEGITFTAQVQIDNFQVNYPGCTEIEGFVQIEGADITNLTGLNPIISIIGGLGIWETSLTSLEGLDNLSQVEVVMGINDNALLVDLSALSNLSDIGGLGINDNSLLSDLQGFENLSAIGGPLNISGNPALTSFEGLGNLTAVDGFLDFFSNPSLINVDPLENLTSIGANLGIAWNDALVSIDGLRNIEAETIESLMIVENFALSDCDVHSICDYLVAPNGTVEIYDNAPGCNSVEEVEEACESQGIESQTLRSLTLHPNPPDNGFITITMDNPQNTQLTCFNTFGQQIHQQEILSGETVINVSTWTPGIHLAVVYEEGKPVGNAKFVVR